MKRVLLWLAVGFVLAMLHLAQNGFVINNKIASPAIVVAAGLGGALGALLGAKIVSFLKNRKLQNNKKRK